MSGGTANGVTVHRLPLRKREDKVDKTDSQTGRESLYMGSLVARIRCLVQWARPKADTGKRKLEGVGLQDALLLQSPVPDREVRRHGGILEHVLDTGALKDV